MNAQKGFIMVKDSSTGKMIPFFVKVRAKDIITDNSNNSKDLVTGIPELKNTSAQWKLVNVFKSIDTVSYVYEQVDLSSMTIGSKDANGETVYNNANPDILASVSTIVYEISSSGLYHVYGTLSTNYDKLAKTTCKWHLPYAIGSKVYSKILDVNPLVLTNIIRSSDSSSDINVNSIIPGRGFLSYNLISIENQKLTDTNNYLYEICVDIYDSTVGADWTTGYRIFNIDIRGKI